MYCCKYPENDCDDFYIGETDRRISERIIDHNKRDKNSYPLQHAQNKKHAHVWVNDFTILNGNYRSKIKRRKSESLYTHVFIIAATLQLMILQSYICYLFNILFYR